LPTVSGPERLVISADLANVSTVRRFVKAVLLGAPDDVVSDLQLAASELVTNAIEHGHGDEVAVEVSAVRSRFELSVTSTDAAADIAPRVDWALPEASARAGRGLGIVGEIADDVDVQRRGSLLTIRVTRRPKSGSLHA
jgi:anti-sigma regulatory factor (Ser/Thr protein kinase)